MMTELKSENQAGNVTSRDALSHERIAELIHGFGWILCGVHGDDDHFTFMHSVGNLEWGMPELLAIDCENEDVLNSLCRLMRKRRAPFWDGELIKLEYYKYPVKALNANADAVKYTWPVAAHYQTDAYLVQQIVIPDSFGRYPGDPQCEKPHCFVPILKGKCRLGDRAGTKHNFARIRK